jgi:predicted TPR repeat methyltransferase
VKNGVIGAEHEFHDKEFATDWAERFTPTPERLDLFNIILSELQSRIPEDGNVVELGIGPGYLANHLLTAMPNITYCGVDFSHPMLDIARTRLMSHSTRVTYTQADLVKEDWANMIAEPIDAIVSTWALHDLGSQKSVNMVYERCANAFDHGGVFLNGDFVKPDGTNHEFEPGRFQIAKHLEFLEKVGFADVECLILLEEETESPTPAQNYACIKGII